MHTDGSLPFEQQRDLSATLRNAVITDKGSLTPNYKYIDGLRSVKMQERYVLPLCLLVGIEIANTLFAEMGLMVVTFSTIEARFSFLPGIIHLLSLFGA